MFSQASVILSAINLMATQSLLMLVTARLVGILLEYLLVWHNFCRKLHENEKVRRGEREGRAPPRSVNINS